MTHDRQFTLRWYFAPRNPIFASNFVSGAFGIGEKQRITFYRWRSAYSHPDSLPPFHDEEFIRRITESTDFLFSDSSLILIRRTDNTTYAFALER
ncbi:MAG: hypothetical protein C4326_14340 [Ignavibacteria bacterium]